MLPSPLTSEQACAQVADEIHALIASRNLERKPTRLGLATGGTMVGVYRALVERLLAEPLDLSQVVTFNLDEFMGLDADHPQSFRAFMREHLFGPAGFDESRCHFPDVELAETQPLLAGEAYTTLIASHGGINLQLLGIGRNGHVAFNEPGSPMHSATRVVPLAESTIEDASAGFGGAEHVPARAITMGLVEIMGARRLRLLAFGEGKAEALRGMLLGPVGSACPASLLREHPDLQVLADADALSLAHA